MNGKRDNIKAAHTQTRHTHADKTNTHTHKQSLTHTAHTHTHIQAHTHTSSSVLDVADGLTHMFSSSFKFIALPVPALIQVSANNLSRLPVVAG